MFMKDHREEIHRLVEKAELLGQEIRQKSVELCCAMPIFMAAMY